MELWDAYDKKMNKIKGVELVRGKRIPDGMFHLVCEVVVKHKDGSYLLTQRDPNKHYGLLWEISLGGSVIKGETSLEGAKRELFEETGITSDEFIFMENIVSPDFKCIFSEYVCITDCNKDSIVLQPGENVSYMWLTREQIEKMDMGDLASKRTLKYL